MRNINIIPNTSIVKIFIYLCVKERYVFPTETLLRLGSAVAKLLITNSPFRPSKNMKSIIKSDIVDW